VRLNLGRIGGEFSCDATSESACGSPPEHGDRVMDLGTRTGRNTRDTCGGTIGSATSPELLLRGVSDHIRGRGLGRPRAHFGWSLTPRNCSWRLLRQ
jgi:hypothetical protein